MSSVRSETIPGGYIYPWKVQDGDSERHYQLAIPTGAQKLVISFEYSAPELPGQITSIMGLRWPARPKRHQLLVGYQINSPKRRRNIDDGKGGLHGGRLRAWDGVRNQAELSIDLLKGGFTFLEGGDQIAGSISTYPIPPSSTLDLSFGQTGIADGAYYPPLGFTFYEVLVMLDGVPIVVDPGPAANTIPAPPPVVVAPPPPPPPPVIVAPPPPPPPVVVTPPTAPSPGALVPPDAAGIAAAVSSICARSGDAGLLAILDGMLAAETGNPAYADLIGLVRVLISGQAPDSAMMIRLASGFASKLPEPWPELVPVIVAAMEVKP